MDETTQTEQATETPAVTAPEPEMTPRAAAALQALMEQEANVRRQASQLKTAEDYKQQLDELRTQMESAPMRALETHGHTFENLTQEVLKGNRPDPTAGLRGEVSDMKRMWQERQEREDRAKYEQALEEARGRIRSYVDSSGEYPLTNNFGMQEAVVQRIQEHVEKTGESLSEDKAASEIEQYLSGLMDKMMEDENIRKRWADKFTQPAPRAPTLSNRHSAQTPSRTEAPRSREESIRRMMEGLRFNE